MTPWGIRHQVLLLAVVPTLTVSILLVAYFTSTRLQDLEQNFQERGEAIALKLAQASEYGVFSRNLGQLQNLALAALKEHDVQSVALYNEKGEEIISIGQKHVPFQPPASAFLSSSIFKEETLNTLGFTLPITHYPEVDDLHSDLSHTETLIGWLKIEFDSTSIHLSEYQVLIHTGILLLLGLSISGFHALQMGRKVTRPILELAQAVDRIKRGELNTRVQTNAYPELKVLESGINTMAESLENAHKELQNKIDRATGNLRRSLETIEVQNLELELARQTAENASKIKSEFLANMSHEIRTPLNAVTGFIHLLNKTELQPLQKEYIETLQRSSTTLLSIINDILDFSKIEAGKLELETSPMDIRDCLTEVLSLMTPHANEKGLTLIPLIYSDVPHHIQADALRIKQILTNLVGNAIKFTEKGSVVVRVMAEQAFERKVILRISVTDSGIGLSDNDQQALFQAFSQANIDTTRKFGGTGLGLVICKRLVEQMQGTIGLESRLNQGTTFWFTFQANKIQALKQSEPIPSLRSDTSFFPSLRVLAVDDNPDNLKLIKIILEGMQVQVTAVPSGFLALNEVKANPGGFDLILMDIRMPQMDGIQTTHAIRAFETKVCLKSTPIIALTAHAFISEREALLAAGVDDYLMKPIEELMLINLLYKWAKKESRDAPLKTVDWALGVKLAAGKEALAAELFEKLIAGLPEDQRQINQAFQARNWTELRDLVHRLHGACCYCGVPNLKQSAQKLESSLATQTMDIIKPRMEAFNHAILAVLEVSTSMSTKKELENQ